MTKCKCKCKSRASSGDSIKEEIHGATEGMLPSPFSMASAIVAKVRATRPSLEEGAEWNAEKTTSVKSGQLGIRKSSRQTTGWCKRFEGPSTGEGRSKFNLARAILIVSCNENATGIAPWMLEPHHYKSAETEHAQQKSPSTILFIRN